MTTKIEWADEVWNPVTGCTQITAGCRNCYAKRMARRLAGRYGYPEAPNHFDVTLRADRLDQPLKWKKPRRIFVCSMSDFFHTLVPLWFQAAILARIKRCPQHTFMILTKRPGQAVLFHYACGWDYPNIWLGVTAENQEQADKRIPLLLQVPAAVRFVSVEPMLGPVDLWRYHHYDPNDMRVCPRPRNIPTRYKRLRWVICGAETGPGARPMKPEWARDLRDQCKAAGVPFFMKAVSGGAIPDDLMIREFPR